MAFVGNNCRTWSSLELPKKYVLKISSNTVVPIVSRYLKFRTISNDNIPNLRTQLLMSLTSPDLGRRLRCDYITGTSRSLPYGPTENKEVCIVMRLEREVTINNPRDLDYVDGFDTVRVEVSDLENPSTCLREARANRYIYSKDITRFDAYYEDTRNFHVRLDNLVSHDFVQVELIAFQFKILLLRENSPSVNVTPLYRWDNVQKASKILNMPQSLRHKWIAAFVCNASKVERTVNVYIGRRNRFGRRIYKKKTQAIINNPLPRDLYEEIFFRYVKKEEFKCVYTEVFKYEEFKRNDGSRFRSILEVDLKVQK